MKILFMCVANSARSQMAEGLARYLFGAKAEVMSSGSNPTSLNPHAVGALIQIGIDISPHTSKSAQELPKVFLDELDYVVTLCAEEVCPVLHSSAKKIHWPFPDPANAGSTEEERSAAFSNVRDGIRRKLAEFGAEHNLL